MAMDLTLEDRTAIYDSYSLEKSGNYDRATQKMNSVYLAHKNNFLINIRLGRLFSLTKKYNNSIEHYEAAAKLAPESIEPWLALSLIYLNMETFEKSLNASVQVLRRDKFHYDGLSRSAAALIRMKRYREALLKVEEALQLYPIDATLLEQKALILVSLGNVDSAKEFLNLLLVISPENPYALSILQAQR
jgi:tetratricopeptide (TPR) repeat protein